MAKRQLLRIDKISPNSPQVRAVINHELITELAAVYRSGEDLPPDPVIFFDGTTYWRGDGYHRIEGRIAAGKATIQCEVREGTERDAILYAVTCNGRHGLRLCAQDKRKAIALLLADPIWADRSNLWIAKQCWASDHTVADVREKLSTSQNAELNSSREKGEESSESFEQQSDTSQDENKKTTGQDGRKRGSKKKPKEKFVCEICKRWGIRTSCPVCKAGGGGTTSTKRAEKNGQVLITSKQCEDHIGHFLRDVAAAGSQWGYKAGKGCPQLAGLDRKAKELMAETRELFKTETKRAKEKTSGAR